MSTSSWGRTETELFIAPVNGARLAANLGEASLDRCAELELSEDPVPIESIVEPFVCVRTDEERISVVRIDKVVNDGSGNILPITFTTFDN